MCLACGRSSMKAGGAGTASWGKGRDEIRDHTDQESHRERSASFGLSGAASVPSRKRRDSICPVF